MAQQQYPTIEDYYSILEVERNADIETIKRSYKKLALRYHPDRNRGNEDSSQEKFKLISEAYATLSDQNKKEQYDRDLENYIYMQQQQQQQQHKHKHQHKHPYDFAGNINNINAIHEQLFRFQPPNIHEFFQNHFRSGPDFGGAFGPQFFFHQTMNGFTNEGGFFGFKTTTHQQQHQQQQQSPTSRSVPITTTRKHKRFVKVDITFKESIYGLEKTITYPVNVCCTLCQGSGMGKGDVMYVHCMTCKGTGRLRTMHVDRPCEDCNGQGRILRDLCKQCLNGSGMMEKLYQDSIIVPAGIIDQTEQVNHLQIKNPKNQNLIDEYEITVRFSVEKHKFFRRDGNDVVIEVPLTMTQAMFGCKLNIPTIYGKDEVISIPPYKSNSSFTATLLRCGFKDPDGKSPIGNQIITFNIEFPVLTDMSDKEIQLYREIAALESQRNSKAQQAFNDFKLNWNSKYDNNNHSNF
ncbi:DNAJ heat shock N-terminal domain-containing protein [Tieghemostelium lacteum]|uniref:DNAJ heat shock N-terminal domain-containing protein n=1 Tax=Tieghemostelium lacteum TaxID=361077 RepID=A0A152A3A4_TIELA|nr:DNAJ heat shock N-terminal domain-containing protein [Tieghemostelium lacteum]|eukprot:KYR00743.1 DNAJ heat shock N-terminal domain-containing protein [Tieghemostelium lacteum]